MKKKKSFARKKGQCKKETATIFQLIPLINLAGKVECTVLIEFVRNLWICLLLSCSLWLSDNFRFGFCFVFYWCVCSREINARNWIEKTQTVNTIHRIRRRSVRQKGQKGERQSVITSSTVTVKLSRIQSPNFKCNRRLHAIQHTSEGTEIVLNRVRCRWERCFSYHHIRAAQPRPAIIIRKINTTVFSRGGKIRTMFWSKFRDGQFFVIIYDRFWLVYGFYWNGHFNSYGKQYNSQRSNSNSRLYWRPPIFMDIFTINLHPVWLTIESDYSRTSSWRVLNCIISKPAIDVIRWFYCSMVFPIAGWVGTIR